MVLMEETPDQLTFRFQGRAWAAFTGLLGLVLTLVAAKVYFASQLPHWLGGLLGS
jgi:hypothetical protein